MRRTVVFDFDGVIHSYTSGWKGVDVIPDPPVIGIREAIAQLRDAGYEVVVVSTRCSDVNGRLRVAEYLDANNIVVDSIMAEKPSAIAYIDDRAICFDGDASTLLTKVQNFEPWYKRNTEPAESAAPAAGNWRRFFEVV